MAINRVRYKRQMKPYASKRLFLRFRVWRAATGAIASCTAWTGRGGLKS
jgi:hypothetical protein